MRYSGEALRLLGREMHLLAVAHWVVEEPAGQDQSSRRKRRRRTHSWEGGTAFGHAPPSDQGVAQPLPMTRALLRQLPKLQRQHPEMPWASPRKPPMQPPMQPHGVQATRVSPPYHRLGSVGAASTPKLVSLATEPACLPFLRQGGEFPGLGFRIARADSSPCQRPLKNCVSAVSRRPKRGMQKRHRAWHPVLCRVACS